jgi:hypothetical protein
MLRRRAALVLVLSASALLVLAGAPTPVPSRVSWSDLDRWYVDVGPAMAAISTLRLAAAVAAGWLVLVSLLQVAAARGGRPHVRALADRLAPRFLRSVACGAATLSLGVALGGSPAGAGAPPPGTAVMVPLDVGPTTSMSTTSTTSAPSPTTTDAPRTTTTATAPPRTTATTATAPTTTTPPGSAVSPPTPPEAVPPHQEVVVAPGDSFWSIAVDETGGRDVEVFWRALVGLNRERLVDPSNPDLLYPGQVLRLP